MQPYEVTGLGSLRGVVDDNGNPLNYRHLQIERLIPTEKAFIMDFMLQRVVTELTNMIDQSRSAMEGGNSNL
jgi:hypothetical protein